MASAIAQVFTAPVPVWSLLLFLYLQGLDLLTTLAFLMNGVHEANPLVRFAIAIAPHAFYGLLAMKAGAMGLGLFCAWKGKLRLLHAANLFFAVLVVWNLVALVLRLATVG